MDLIGAVDSVASGLDRLYAIGSNVAGAKKTYNDEYSAALNCTQALLQPLRSHVSKRLKEMQMHTIVGMLKSESAWCCLSCLASCTFV